MSKLVDKGVTALVKRKVDVQIGDGQYLDTAVLTVYSASRIRDDFRRRFNIKIPKVPNRDVNPYHVLKEALDIQIRIDDILHVYNFKRGYCWDLSSTLRSMKCLLDNDDPRTIIASLPHDAGPRTKGMKFREANQMYYWISRFFRLPVPLAILSWTGISSLVGVIKWRKNKKRREYLDEFFTYEKYQLISTIANPLQGTEESMKLEYDKEGKRVVKPLEGTPMSGGIKVIRKRII